jgi:hypothetical protein
MTPMRSSRAKGFVEDPVGRFVQLAHGIAGGVAVDERLVVALPAVLRQLRMGVVEEGDGALGLDDGSEAAERVDAVHPVEGAADGDEAERAELRPEIVGAALDELDGDAGLGCGCRRGAQHFRLGVDRHDAADEGREGDSKLAGAATEIEQPVGRAETATLDGARDQATGVGRTAGEVIGRGRLEAARLEGEGRNH